MKYYETPDLQISSLISDRAIAYDDDSDNIISDLWIDETESEEEE